jgi:hypothetical protein
LQGWRLLGPFEEIYLTASIAVLLVSPERLAKTKS